MQSNTSTRSLHFVSRGKRKHYSINQFYLVTAEYISVEENATDQTFSEGEERRRDGTVVDVEWRIVLAGFHGAHRH